MPLYPAEKTITARARSVNSSEGKRIVCLSTSQIRIYSYSGNDDAVFNDGE
jgi:hypothetical protein